MKPSAKGYDSWLAMCHIDEGERTWPHYERCDHRTRRFKDIEIARAWIGLPTLDKETGIHLHKTLSGTVIE